MSYLAEVAEVVVGGVAHIIFSISDMDDSYLNFNMHIF
jgi:hypothetical protein